MWASPYTTPETPKRRLRAGMVITIEPGVYIPEEKPRGADRRYGSRDERRWAGLECGLAERARRDRANYGWTAAEVGELDLHVLCLPSSADLVGTGTLACPSPPSGQARNDVGLSADSLVSS